MKDIDKDDFCLKDAKALSAGTLSTGTPFSLLEKDPDEYSELNYSNSSGSIDGVEVLGSSEPQNVSEWIQRETRIIKTTCYKRVVLGLILVSSILLGVRTFFRDDTNVSDHLDSAVYAILIAFTVESFISVMHYHMKIIRMGWVLFDLTILILSWTLNPTIMVLRLFRLIRGMRRATGFTELKQLVRSMLRALPKMTALAFLVLIVFYVFAVLFTDLFQEISYDEQELSQNYFGRLDTTLFTLFQITTLDGWSEIAREVIAVHRWSWLLFISFIIVTTLFFGALVIGVMSEAVASASTERIWKSLDVRDSKATEVAKLNQSSHATRRLEEKVEQLTASVEKLARMQASLQETVKQLSQTTTDGNKTI